MSPGPGAAGLLWLWATVAELGPGDPPQPPPRPAPDPDHGSRPVIADTFSQRIRELTGAAATGLPASR